MVEARADIQAKTDLMCDLAPWIGILISIDLRAVEIRRRPVLWSGCQSETGLGCRPHLPQLTEENL